MSRSRLFEFLGFHRPPGASRRRDLVRGGLFGLTVALGGVVLHRVTGLSPLWACAAIPLLVGTIGIVEARLTHVRSSSDEGVS